MTTLTQAPIPSQRYRVAYRQSFSEQCRYEYFDTEGQAKARFRALRQKGYFGACQFWNRIEQMWIG